MKAPGNVHLQVSGQWEEDGELGQRPRQTLREPANPPQEFPWPWNRPHTNAKHYATLASTRQPDTSWCISTLLVCTVERRAPDHLTVILIFRTASRTRLSKSFTVLFSWSTQIANWFMMFFTKVCLWRVSFKNKLQHPRKFWWVYFYWFILSTITSYLSYTWL